MADDIGEFAKAAFRNPLSLPWAPPGHGGIEQKLVKDYEDAKKGPEAAPIPEDWKKGGVDLPPTAAPTVPLSAHIAALHHMSQSAPVMKMPEMDVEPRMGPVAPAGGVQPEAAPEEAPPPPAAAAPSPAAPAAPAAPADDAELKEAQAEARRKRLWGILPALFGGNVQQIRENANQPVADLLQRREQLRKLGEDKQKKTETDRANAAYDPKSPQTMLARQLLATKYGYNPKDIPADFTAAQMHDVIGGASFEAARKKEESEKGEKAGALAREIARDNASEKHAIEQEKLARRGQDIGFREHQMSLDAQKEKGAKEAAPKPPKPLATKDVEALSDLKNAVTGVRGYKQHFNDLGALGALTPEGGQLSDEARRLAPLLAESNALGGKANPKLIAREEENLPGRFSFKGKGAADLDAKEKALVEKYKSRVQALKAQGANTEGFDPDELDQSAPAHAPHPQDNQAVAWAKANPKDPSSAAILKANGL